MSVPPRFQDKEYTNWVKCSLALVLMKEGLHDYVDAGVKKLHDDIKQKVTSAIGGPSVGKTCGFCTWKNVSKRSKPFKWYINCSSSVCDKWLSEILLVHTEPHNKSINWKNAVISSWPTKPYEVAKVYMPKGQDRNHKNLPQELDASAILSLLKFCTMFSTSIQNIQLLEELIEVRNTVLHSGVLRISNSDKDLWIDKMIQLLSDLNISSDTQSELNKVKCEDIDMNFREIEIRALQNLVSSQERAIAEVKGEITSLQNIQIQHSEERAKDMEEMKKCLIELKTISDKIVNFLDENQDLDKEIIGNFRKVEKYVHDLQNKFFQLEERVSSLEKDQEDTKEQLANHEEKIEDLEKNQQESKMQVKEMDRRLDAVEKKSEKDNELVHQKEIGHLRKDLKSCYKTLSSIPISPFDEEETLPLQDLYMDVMIEHQTEGKNAMNGNSKDRNSEMLSSYKEIFFDKRHQRIILTGLSGSGKSVFCRNIVYIWSTEEPNKQNEYAQEKDLSIPDKQRVMAEKKETGHTCIVEELDMCDPQSSEAIADQDILLQFTLLFYICAPKIDSEKTLTEVLHKQCIQIESDHLSKFFKEQPEKVLIIIDGIDEMKGEMPSFLDDLLKRKLHPRIIVLMVMRHWKISQLKLKPSSHYDLLLEVQGMSEKEALKFVQKMINVCRNHMTVKRLDPSPEEKKVMSSFKKTPLLLMFLARIWCQDQSLPKRQQDLYRKIFECVIERFLNKTGSKYILASTAQDTISIKKKAFWEMHMESACRVAHNFLLQGVSGSSVVMSEMDLMKQFGDNSQLKLNALLGCGILSKLDAFSPLGEKNVSVAFLHLSVQEYLTSVHLVRNENAFQNFLISLKTLNDILKYENLFIFICGLDADKGHTAFKRVCEVCDDDPHVRQYRRGKITSQRISSIDNLNEMYRACLNEMDNQSLVKMTDIRVHNIKWYNNLIPKLEPGFVKSLELNLLREDYDEGNVVICYNYIHLEHLDLCNITLHNDVIGLSSLTKLTYLKLIDVTMTVECSRSLSSSIKSCFHLEMLCLGYITLHDGVIDLSSLTKLTYLQLNDVIMSVECNRSLCSSIKSCIHLEMLDLQYITLHDGVIDLSSLTKQTNLILNKAIMSVECSRSLCSSIKSCIHLERLYLEDITLHNDVIDLSSLIKLTNLILNKAVMSVECSRSLCSSIKSCIHLERLELQYITLHDGVIDLSSLTKLTNLMLNKAVMSVECSRSLCSSIKSCIHLERLELQYITLHDGVIDLSSLTKLTYLELIRVTMTVECSRSLCSSIKSCIQLECLYLWYITLHDGVIDLSSLTKLTYLILNKAIMSVECSRSLCSSIKSCIHLKHLHLEDITLHNDVIDLSSLTKLTNLILNKAIMSVECSRSLCSSIKSCIHLEHLYLEDITLHNDVIDLSSLTKLTYLILNKAIMSVECSRSLCSSIKSCIHLEMLDLQYITLHDGVIDLSSLTKLTNLILNKAIMSVECSRSLCNSINSCIHLECLRLQYITLHDGVIDLSSLTKLTNLILNKAIMSVECSRSLCSSIKSCIHLEMLDLQYITLHDGVIDSNSLTKLTYLELIRVTMTLECSRSLCSSIKSCIHLKMLDLQYITLHDGVIDLSSLTKLTNLILNKAIMCVECSRSLCSSIKSCIHLECLHLEDITLHNDVIDLSSLTKLTNLILNKAIMSVECSRSLCNSINSCIHLECLRLQYITLHDGVIDLSSLTKLTNLILNKAIMSVECSRSLCSSIKSCIHLKCLHLEDITLHNDVIDLSSLTKLTNLILNKAIMYVECSRSLCSSIKSCIHLERLELQYITLHDGVIDLSSLTKLTYLELIRVTMTVECSRSLCSSINSCIHLERLKLQYITLHDGVIDSSSLTKLTYLELICVTMTVECSRSLCSSIKSCIHLECLRLQYITLHDGVIDLSSLTKLTNLILNKAVMSVECSRSLCSSIKSCIHLENMYLEDITLHNDVIDLSSLTKLTNLILNKAIMSVECSRSLCSSIKSCIHLERLELQYITLHDGVIDLSSLTKLTNLILNKAIMSVECSRSLCSSIKSCIHLKHLHLEDTTLHDDVIDLSSLTKLTNLILNKAIMSVECSRSLCSSIKSCIHLERLHLEDITLHDGVIDLSSLTKLTYLKLIRVTMTVECSRSLCSSIKSCIHLERLYLEDITLHNDVIDLSSLIKLNNLILNKAIMSVECSRSLCSSINSCIHLERLELQYITLHDGVIDLSSLTKLTNLILNKAIMSVECSRSLCSSIKNCIHLVMLYLWYITLHDGVIDLSSLTKLTYLQLNDVTMTVECSRSLCSSIKSCIHLECLHLEDIRLHDGVIDLSSLSNLSFLVFKNVSMSTNCRQTLETSRKWCQKLKYCEINKV